MNAVPKSNFMEKGIIFDIKKFAIHDGPGIRTTVFLKGCPLRCWWCHNPESFREFPAAIAQKDNLNLQEKSIHSNFSAGVEYSVNELKEEIKKDIIFYDESGGGVTFSGGEPMMQVNFLGEILRECKKMEISTAIDTSGYAESDAFESVYPLTDIFLFDLKLIDNRDHLKYTEVSNEIILNNLRLLAGKGNKVVIRIPLIPGITDTEKNLNEIAAFVKKLSYVMKIDLLPYNIFTESKYNRLNTKPRLGKLETQTEEELQNIKSFFDSFGFRVTLRG